MLGRFVNQQAEDHYFAGYEALALKWPVASETLDVQTRYGPTRVRRSGTAQGTPIVLLAGMMGTSLSWYPYVAELAARHTVHAIDAIGEPGRSIQTRALETDDDMAAWLDDVLTALGHDEVHLVGLSRGGFLALSQAVRATDRLASVIAFEPAGFRVIGARFILWSLTEMFQWLLPAAILRRVAPGSAEVRHSFRPLLFRGLKYKSHLPPQHVFTDDELRAIDVPTWLILGERSVIHRASEVAARVEKLNPRVRAEIVPKASHSLTMQRPELVIDRILDLVAAE
ncbi:alpha/beta fold hydrolase [Kibdelosporangium phytohabitans]|uniref:Alpha/beta hydrolase n=1 Tax=Kibdelosporangium phytohabitans TaxID=860235 RepID=A0A0N9I180_9PSEU|nr:alpha/beta fold hydrolase [Kibdelosporangium phytohabitans]ALG08430.1 alpha/beta hydrolase [Kibdelosporangium phytohabitans]MBE1470520.1 pimeloyl-ACP methyl ester carboxylesterase [Kibdelosporangium phytohabitans]